jgi:HAD superfamily hydrolase (TIGR01490 family)
MALALFDLDRTVLSVNSASLWVRRQWREGRLPTGRMALAGWWLTLYRLGLMRADRALHDAVASMAGALEDDLERRTRRFWGEECADAIRPGARAAIARHRARGERAILCTSSSAWISRCAVEALGLDGYLSTEVEVVGGRLTGRISGTPNFGAGKLANLERYVAGAGVPPAEVWFYTDSAADLPLLRAVGHPVCVAPDPRLLTEARQRGWPVEDWG